MRVSSKRSRGSHRRKWKGDYEERRKETEKEKKGEKARICHAFRVLVVATAVTLEIALLLLRRRVEKSHRDRFSGRDRARATQANVRSWLSCGLPPAMGSVSASLLMASRSNRIRNRRRSSKTMFFDFSLSTVVLSAIFISYDDRISNIYLQYLYVTVSIWIRREINFCSIELRLESWRIRSSF